VSRVLPRAAHRSWWFEEALRDPAVGFEPRPPLRGSTRADVVVLGGGYTGLWTAWHLLGRAPGIDVVVLEQDVCGGGPSGRNGGFLGGLWEDLPALVRAVGEAGALRVAEACDRSIDAIESWCRDEGVDAWLTRRGHLLVESSPAQRGAWRPLAELAARLGAGDRFVPLSSSQVRARCASPVLGAGVLQPSGATLQPARLALGLRRALLERGVRIHEGTRVVRFTTTAPVVVETEAGRVEARDAVLALGAWCAGLPRFRRVVIPRGSYIVITEPAPDRLAELGWTGGEGIADLRASLRYVRTTPDGRIAFGQAGSAAGLGTGLGPRLRYDPDSIARLVRDLPRLFPPFAGVRIEAAWGGPIDVTGRHLPTFGTLPGGAVRYGVGYTGGGVGPSHLGGSILADLVLGIDDGAASLPLVGLEPSRFPPEPLRSVGAALVQRAIVRAEDREEAGGRPDPLTRFAARLPRRLGYDLGP
jgi:glycine/D-amino acid oxidase-like deaminating enzyme